MGNNRNEGSRKTSLKGNVKDRVRLEMEKKLTLMRLYAHK